MRLALGSDTNGSTRVPVSLGGAFGLKPTFDRRARRGSFPFVASIDHLGPFARSVEDLAASDAAMKGADALDRGRHATRVRPVLPRLQRGADGLRIGALGCYFKGNAESGALPAVTAVTALLIGGQVIAAPRREALALRVARATLTEL